MKPNVIVEIPNALHCCEVIIVMHWFVMLSHQHEKTELSLMQKKIKIFYDYVCGDFYDLGICGHLC